MKHSGEVKVEPKFIHVPGSPFKPVALLDVVVPTAPLVSLISTAIAVKGTDPRAVSLNVYGLEGDEFKLHADELSALQDEVFKGLPITERVVLPFQSAITHRDKTWSEMLFLSIAAVESRLSISAAHGNDEDATTISVVTGQVFALDPSSWHSACNSIRGSYFNVLLQCSIPKLWVLENMPEVLKPMINGEVIGELLRIQNGLAAPGGELQKLEVNRD